jgi:hypothetical protein
MRPGGTLKSARNLARGLACQCSAQRLAFTKDRTLLTPGTGRALDPLRLREPATRARSELRVRDPPLPLLPSVHTRAPRGEFERACRTATQTIDLARSLTRRGGAACRLLLRFFASGSSAASSQPAALARVEALGCNQRALGFLLCQFISSSNWTARSSFLRWPCFDRVCRAAPLACNGHWQAAFSSIEALARSTPTNGCCSRRPNECESRKKNLLAVDRPRKDQVDSRIGKKDGEFLRRPPQMRRIEGYSRGKCWPGCMEAPHLRRE